jgi:drug/metabolite transporter (DMT)-like permease
MGRSFRAVDNGRMKRRDLADLVLLAALWGASFLFTRMAVPAFGAFALAELRVAIAALMLLPLLALRGDLSELRSAPARFVLLGAVNTAIPFALFAWAVLSITAGLASILNATAPLFAALVAWVWLRERLTVVQWIGMGIGFAGVLWLSFAKAGFGGDSGRWAIIAALAATFSYGLSASVAKRYFTGVRPLAVAAGSQTAAALLLLPFAVATWPAAPPSAIDWAAAVALGVLCTGVAYILYFRLIARVGPATAMTVTFLIPAFAMLWGGLFLAEAVTPAMLIGCAIILAGTALATGLVRSRRPASTSHGTS